MPYSYWQLSWGIGIVGVPALGALLARQYRAIVTPLRFAIAIALVSFELQRFFTVSIRFPDRMPFYLCNISTWAAVLVCLTLNSLAVEFLYFIGLTAAVMTLLTPDMGSQWPAPFFLNHGGIVMAAIVLIFGKVVRMRPGAPWRAFSMGMTYFAAGGIFDWGFGTNYSFTMHKPPRASLLDILGPWPLYWFAATLILLFLMWILWLPVRTAPSAGRLFSAQDRERFFA
jgi:hypothetical integral membrane protein (TIGR02206 family)